MDCGTRERLIKVRCMRRTLTPSGLVGVSRIIRKFLAGNFGKGENPLEVMAAASLLRRNSGWLGWLSQGELAIIVFKRSWGRPLHARPDESILSAFPFSPPLLRFPSPISIFFSPITTLQTKRTDGRPMHFYHRRLFLSFPKRY